MHAFLWQDGTMTDLGGLPGYQFSVAWDINDRGQVVGSSYGDDGTTHAVLWENGGGRGLGDLGGPAAPAFGINRAGEGVWVSLSGVGRIRPFTWEDGVASGVPASVRTGCAGS